MDELRDTQYNLPIGTDCISRRKLLDKFEPWLEVHDYNDGERNVIKAVLYEIKCMPPATDNNVATRDCISRQAAIDVCDNVIDLFRGQFGAGVVVAIKESIEELPSAQPATDTNAGTKLGTNLAEVGTDCISRQAALNALHTWFRDGFDEDKWWNSTHVLAVIEGLPSAQPEIIRCKDCKHAEYIDDVQTLWCTECGQGRTVAPHDFCSYAERRTGWMTN